MPSGKLPFRAMRGVSFGAPASNGAVALARPAQDRYMVLRLTSGLGGVLKLRVLPHTDGIRASCPHTRNE